MEKHIKYLLTHKPNLVCYYTHSAEKTINEFCSTIDNCENCKIKNWCDYSPWTEAVRAKIMYLSYFFREKVYSPLFTYFWHRFKNGEYLICSRCGWKEDLKKWSFIDTDFKKIDGKWVCHHCQHHINDDWIENKTVPHEKFTEYWEKCVLEHNREIEEQKQ